jgi:hypothetical protein
MKSRRECNSRFIPRNTDIQDIVKGEGSGHSSVGKNVTRPECDSR